MGPSGERFHRHDLPCGDVDQGLIPQIEFASTQCRAQVHRQATSSVCVVHVVTVEDGVATGAGVLGPIHRQIGAADEFLAGRTRVGDGDADARAKGCRFVSRRVRGVDRCGQGMRELLRVVDSADVFGNDEKFVAANAGNGVLWPRGGGEPAGEPHQRTVSGFVTETVIDDLEIVDVEQ